MMTMIDDPDNAEATNHNKGKAGLSQTSLKWDTWPIPMIAIFLEPGTIFSAG